MSSRSPSRPASPKATHGLARVISRRGICSRSQAEAMVRAGRVRVEGRLECDPERRTPAEARITIDGAEIAAAKPIHLMLNKPRGLVTTSADERGRDTVYACFAGADLPWIAPVGRLDKASEGLLLFSNDSAWAAAITDPVSSVHKTYHVQVGGLPDAGLLERIRAGLEDDGEHLAAVRVHELRRGEKNAWLEIVLDEGRNRHIRRLLAAFDLPVLRLIRVAIGTLQLGDLAKGQWRHLSAAEIAELAPRK